MKAIRPYKLKRLLKAHEKWVNGKGGQRLILLDATISNVDLSGVNLSRAYFKGVKLLNVNLSDAIMHEAVFEMCEIRYVNFSKAELNNAIFDYKTEIIHSDFESAKMDCARLSCTYIVSSNFGHAELPNSVIKQSQITLSNFLYANLRDADISDSRIGRSFFMSSDLQNASFCKSFIIHSNFKMSNLSNSNMDSAYIDGSSFALADMQKVILTGSLFNNVTLHKTKLDKSEEIRRGIILEKDMIGYKKCLDENNKEVIVTLNIPKGAVIIPRTKGYKTNIAYATKISRNKTEAFSKFIPDLKFEVGKETVIKNFDLDYTNQDGAGIYFVKSKKELNE